MLSIALILAIVAFLKTPKEQRYKILATDENAENPEYAPQFSVQERMQLLFKTILLLVPIFIFGKFWFFSWLSEYSEKANCYYYGQITGAHLLIYGVFVGIPLGIAIILFIFEGIGAIRVLKVGQFPLPGQKVLRSTKYKYGVRAKARGLYILFCILMFVGLSIWGFVQAKKLTNEIKPCESQLTSTLERERDKPGFFG